MFCMGFLTFVVPTCVCSLNFNMEHYERLAMFSSLE